MAERSTTPDRYARQIACAALGSAGQKALADAHVLIVGVGGLGTHLADLLARAGVGRLRLVDDDRVERVNLHRQVLFTERDAAAARPKAQAAAAAVAAANSDVHVEPVVARFSAESADQLAGDVSLVLDATDHFPSRFVINDHCVRNATPWVMAGVVSTEGQVMPVLPGRSPCLRCILDEPPPASQSPTAATAGVLGPVVATVAAWQATEAMRLIARREGALRAVLTKIDLWPPAARTVDLTGRRDPQCPCCGLGRYDHL
jgi:adenylyltransferase/sulfurtransferase